MKNLPLDKSAFYEIIQKLANDKSVIVTDDLPLIGSESILDSMKLVELCLNLEDEAVSLGFEFDWTSEVALSKSKSMFRTAQSLYLEFIFQFESGK